MAHAAGRLARAKVKLALEQQQRARIWTLRHA
jgi:hypothetical protein